MTFNFRIKENPFGALLSLVALILVGSVISGLLFAAIAYVTPSFREILYAGAPQTGDFLRAMLLLNFPIMFLLPTLYIANLYRPWKVKELILAKRILDARYVGIAIAAILICQPALNLIGEINKQMTLPEALHNIEQWIIQSEAQAETVSKLVTETSSTTILLFNIFILGILPGVCEEVLFRGVIQSIFLDIFRKKHIAVWVGAFLFSFIHFQFYGFVPRMLLGGVLGYLVLYSGSLWTSVLAHTINNTLVVVLSYMQFNHIIGKEIDSIGIADTTWIGILSLIATIALVYFIPPKEEKDEHHQS